MTEHSNLFNRLFYSCLLSDLVSVNGSEARGDLVLIQTSPATFVV